MPKESSKKYMVDFVFTLCLFGVFAVSALLVVVIGANVYRSTVNAQEANAMKRTALAYVAEKVHQSDTADSISIGSVEGTDALVLKSRYNDASFATYIYWYDGSLRELFIKEDAKPALIAGQVITEIADFSLTQYAEHLYLVSATDNNGETLSLYINAKCGSQQEQQENTP